MRRQRFVTPLTNNNGAACLDSCAGTGWLPGSLATDKDNVGHMLITCENMQQTAKTRPVAMGRTFHTNPNRQVACFRIGTWIVSPPLPTFRFCWRVPFKPNLPFSVPKGQLFAGTSASAFISKGTGHRARRVCRHTNYKRHAALKEIVPLI